MKDKIIILSLGGSLLCNAQDQGPKPAVILAYANWLKQLTKKYDYVVAFTGGGYVARLYIETAKNVNTEVTPDDQDWVGIQASRLNAELLRVSCGAMAAQKIIDNPKIKLADRYKNKSQKIIIGCGWKPGRSTDYDAVMLAVKNNVPEVYNLTNTHGVYTKDPKKFPDAKFLPDLTWGQLRDIVGTSWVPGANVPFDPIAAKLAAHHHLTVKILNGTALKDLTRAVSGQKFHGTIVHA